MQHTLNSKRRPPYRNIKIYKSHGGQEHFSKKKLISSIKRSGLSHRQSQRIAERISQDIAEGAKTKDIFRKTLRLVKQDSPMAAIHYSLKRAILDLGPAGHHFETFVARYFKELGYHTLTRQSITGKLVKHEVDVIAMRNKKKVFVECKFHNRVGLKNDIKLVLYVKARWDDLRSGPAGKTLDGFYVASNTSFTQDALTYADGTGLKLLGVNAPRDNSFLDQVMAMHLYPITSLKRLSKGMVQELIEKDVILARDIPANINLLHRIGIPEDEINLLLGDVETLLRSGT